MVQTRKGMECIFPMADGKKERIVCSVQMDGKLYVMCEHRMYYLDTDGKMKLVYFINDESDE